MKGKDPLGVVGRKRRKGEEEDLLGGEGLKRRQHRGVSLELRSMSNGHVDNQKEESGVKF